MTEIKTALERFQSYCKSKGIPEKSSLAHIHKMDQFEEHERKELRTAYEALENERDELKQSLNDLQERFNGIKFIESELRKENDSLNAEVLQLKNELITSLKDWHDLYFNHEALQKENDELKSEIDSLQTERQIMQDTNLAVVRRLQLKIDSLEREAKKDARYIANAQQESKDSEDSFYNCGEL